jgi:hypothetical protein
VHGQTGYGLPTAALRGDRVSFWYIATYTTSVCCGLRRDVATATTTTTTTSTKMVSAYVPMGGQGMNGHRIRKRYATKSGGGGGGGGWFNGDQARNGHEGALDEYLGLVLGRVVIRASEPYPVAPLCLVATIAQVDEQSRLNREIPKNKKKQDGLNSDIRR